MENANTVESHEFQPESSYVYHFESAPATQESILQQCQQQQQHEVSLEECTDEENIAAVQQQIQLKSQAALEKLVKQNIKSDLVKHKVQEGRRSGAELEARLRGQADEREDLNNMKFIQNAKLEQVRREMENIKRIVAVFEKHRGEDDAAQRWASERVARHRAKFAEFGRSVKRLKEIARDVNEADAEIYRLEVLGNHLAGEYDKKIAHLHEQIKRAENSKRESDAILREKLQNTNDCNKEIERLQALLKNERTADAQLNTEIMQTKQSLQTTKIQHEYKQREMNKTLDDAAKENASLENALQSVCNKQTSLRQHLAELNANVAVKTDESARLIAALAENECTLETLAAKTKAAKNELQDVDKKQADFVRITQCNIDGVTSDYRQAQMQRQQYEEESAKIAESVQAEERAIATLKEELSAANNNINAMAASGSTLKETRGHLLAENESLAQSLKDLQWESNVQRVAYETQRTDRERSLRELGEELAGIEREHAMLSQQHGEELEEMGRNHAMQEELTRREYETQLAVLRASNGDFEEGLRAKKARNAALQQVVDAKTAFRNSLLGKYKNLQMETEGLKKAASQPVGILKPAGEDFVVPPAPKIVSFRNTISFNSTSNSTDLDSLFEEVAMIESRYKQQPPPPLASQSDDVNSIINDLFMDSEGGSNMGTASSPPTRLTE